MRLLITMMMVSSLARATDFGSAVVPKKFQAALARAVPKGFELTAFVEKDGAITVTARGRSFDDVSEFMRGLNNLVRSPKGLGRIVERKRRGNFVRIEHFEGQREVLEYSSRDLHFFFPNLELKSTVTRGARVEFELASSPPP